MAIKISFCIPTLNRGAFIGATLESIISQATESVEIVIVDGGSTDNTSEVVRQHQKIFPRLHYFRTDEADVKAITAAPSNIGFDQDCSRAVELAQGEYCWLFTDDDLLKPGAISTVLNEIPKGYGLIVVNAQVMNVDFSKVLENKRILIDTNEIYSEYELEPLFNRVVSYLSFVGCVVIRRDLWMQREKKRYLGTGFIHLGVIFQAPLPAGALVIAEPCITIRLGNAQWASRSFEIWMFKWPNLLCTFTHISEKALREYRKKQSWRRLRKIITFRAMGEYSLKEYHKWFTSKDLSLWWRAIVLFIAIIPACIVNLFMLLYFKAMWVFVALFMAVIPARFANLSILSYFKKTKKEALLNIYPLENNENNIMNIVRRKGLWQSHK
jgi:glycosyltransferase involved in cell wall biosynthesis